MNTAPTAQGRASHAPATVKSCCIHLARPTGFSTGLDFAIRRGWLRLHESGTYVKFC
jgi:hypothetical protein